MKRRSEDPRTRGFLFRAAAITIGVLVSASSFANSPDWWSQRSVLVPNASADDYALVNQGQLKNLAAAAAAEMDARVPAGAGTAVHNLLALWEAPNSQRNDFAPLNLGQLKNVAKPFYDQLIAAGLVQSYPWAGGTPDDFALANIGQVKTLFSFALNIFGDRLATGLYSASLAVQPDATLWTWGPQPGDGYNHERSYPLPLASLSNVISASAGSYHAAVLKTDGTVSTWGHNDSGQLGDGTETNRSVPAPVLNLSNVISVKAGYAHTLALVQDGTVLGWGENYYGQLGNGDTTDASAPITVAGLTSVRKIAAGYERSAALREDGTVWTWGYEHYDWEAHYQLTPTLVDGLTEVTDIAAGIEHVVVVKSDGTVWAWGANWANQLGNGAPNGLYQATPIQVPSLADIVSVASAYDHTLALARDGTVWAWGSNNSGQLGIGTTAAQSAPVHISSLTDVIAIAAGQWYSMAMKSDGTVWAWGQSTSALGQTMDGSSTLTPHQTVLGMVDQNNNTMDDRWETDYFGNLDQTADGDFDGDGISNVDEFLAGGDPTNYYNGALPALSIINGDNQTADPGVFLPQPLIVQVNDSSGRPLVNAPIIFAATDGLVGLTPDPDAVDSTVTAHSDANGQAVVYFETPDWPNETVTVTATAMSGANNVNVQFTEMTDMPPPPDAPSDVTAVRQSDGSTVVTWVSHSTNEDGFVIRRQNLDQSWSTLAFANAGATSAVIAPPTQAVADTRDYDVGAYIFTYTNANYSDETNPATVRYAIVDLGTANPFRITNSGYVLLSGWYPLHGAQRWFQGQVQNLIGGDDPLLTGGMDINESGTVVGTILSSPFSGPNPLTGRAPVSPPEWYKGAGTVRLAARWDIGQADPTLLGPSFSFSIAADPSNTYTGTIKGSYAYAIDNNGDIFGETIVGYQEAPAYYDSDGNFHGTAWGSLYSGYNYTSGMALGDQSLVLGSDGYTTQGHAAYVEKARNGVAIGQLDENNPYNLSLTGTVNGFAVSFTPINLNDYAMVLGRSNNDWFLYDATSGQTTKDLEIPTLYSYFLPQALNHRQIPAYDANGQPILDQNGQQVMKESPQVVGTDASFGFTGFDVGDIATIWEENPIGGHYEMQYLNRLISPDSGWDLQVARDINDDGVIACDGWYQAYDSNGNPVGDRQWRACLLVPTVVFRDDAQTSDDDNFTTPLVDWPATGSKPRSPRYLFTQNDNILVRVTDTPGMGNDQIKVKVTTETDPSGVVFDLAEISPGVYANKPPAKPLRLGTATAVNSDAVTIKTISKEALKFTLLRNGIEAVGADVMVARAKFASCGIDIFYKNIPGDETIVQAQAIANAKLFPAGNGEFQDNVVEEGNAMATFIQNAGDQSDGESTWLHLSSHGLPDGTLGDSSQSLTITYAGFPVVIHNHYPNGIGYISGDTFVGGQIVRANQLNPALTWNKDLKWVVMAACDALNQIGGGSAQWQSTLNLNAANHIHGLLGGYEELAGDLQSHWNTFWTLLQSGSRVIDAYEQAMESGDTQPWAVLYDGVNEDDQLKEITQDGPGYAAFAYITTNDLIVGGRGIMYKRLPLVETIDSGHGLVRTVLPGLPTAKTRSVTTLLRPVDFTETKTLRFAKRTATFPDGAQTFLGRGLRETTRYKTSLSKDDAAELATDYLKRYFPEFSNRLVLKEVDERMSGIQHGAAPGSTWGSGFLVQFKVTTGGVPVGQDYVHVTISADSVEGVTFHVCDEPQQSIAAPQVVQPLDVRSCLFQAIPQIKALLGIQSQYEVLKAELVYANRNIASGVDVAFDNKFVLSWHLLINPKYQGQGAKRHTYDVWLNAASADVIGTKRH
jgi:alpha-tubulin suppressor-like RCC1 family protein